LPFFFGHFINVLSAAVANHNVHASISATAELRIESEVDRKSEFASKQLDRALSELRQIRLRKHFQSILDHDQDGIVTRWEAAVGILSLGERATLSREKTLSAMEELKLQSLAQLGVKPELASLLRRDEGAPTVPMRHKVIQDPCLRPENIFFNSAFFIDCVTARARHHLADGLHPDEEVNGHAELLALHSSAGVPDDMPPPDRNFAAGVTCDEARAKGGLVLHEECPSLYAAGFCRVSCPAFLSRRPISSQASVSQTSDRTHSSGLQFVLDRLHGAGVQQTHKLR
jgi:hypothetical protein